MKTELLAPAKNIEIAKAAIDAGADAVYIGAYDFGARYKAGNSLEDIADLVQYAHKFYVKVMVTVNTIIKDNEIPDVKSLIKKLYDIGVDSIIVQDMAILKWAIDGSVPPIPLHISTQCDNRTEEKIKFFNDIGISRVVLARELSVEQIKNIITKNPDLEIETFIHGALCVSYSGQCYLSQYIGGRSANRGECAQPCRKKYSVVDDKGNVIVKDKHVLSLKDFSTLKYLPELVNIGVKSFKIEGRLKDINYVKNVVGFYRKELDKYSNKTSSGEITLNFEPDIYKTFNRGYTNYFLNGRENCFNFDSPKFVGEYIGIVSKLNKNTFELKLSKGIELSAQDGLVFGEDGEIGCMINKIENNSIYPNNMPKIKTGMGVYRNYDALFNKKLNVAKIYRKIGIEIRYSEKILYVVDEDGNTAELYINECETAKNQKKMNENFKEALMKTGDSDFYIKEINILSDVPFMPISKANEYRRGILDKLLKERVKNYKREKQKPLRYLQYPLKELDYRANVYNNDALAFYKNCGVNITEMAFEKNPPKHPVELMRTKHCIKYALNMCKSLTQLYLLDEYGKKVKLAFDCKNCEMVILND